MELIFNLIWLALSSVLVGLWLWHRDRWADDPLRSSLTVQIVALLLLVVILLPVVSLTDDLHATALLYESDHVWRRGDFQTAIDFALHTLTIALIGLGFFDLVSRRRRIGWFSQAVPRVTSCAGYLRLVGIRPPPAV